jgi:anti-sigma-K factor RskA
MFAIAFVVVRNEPTTVAPAPDAVMANAAATRTSLVDEASDVITLPWAPPTAAGYENVTGDVVWSQSRQQGYLRLANMPVNDPARTQYQLWIVDPDRDKNPVDGGVFNISATGEVIIPIQAKLLIRSPRAFAITAEQPGGVVVSAGPLLVVASI